MGKLEYFKITLNRPAYFRPGEMVSGIVSIKAVEKFKINSISVCIDSTPVRQWNTFCNNKHALGKDNENQIILFEKQPNECLYLDTVDYSYLFQIKLPENLPSSFSPSGKIRYSFKAILDIPKTFNEYAFKPFTVISQADQNQINPSLKETFKSTESLLPCFRKCNTKTIKL